MPWLVGIDEAGYGPNLGPFVMAAVACRVPSSAGNLWQLLDGAVCQHAAKAQERLLIADSKVVYSSGKGLSALERGVLAALFRALPPPTLGSLLEQLQPAWGAELQAERWYRGATPLPQANALDHLQASAGQFDLTCQARSVSWALPRCAIVCAERFNALIKRWGSKGSVLAVCLGELLQHVWQLGEPDEPIVIHIDKHGGRNTYSAMLQEAVPAGYVVALEEGAAKSCYEVQGMPRPVRITFQPRADGDYFCVALASMLAKYVRELLMLEFNDFWRQHLPTLKPTAGYPLDATRFMDAIRSTAARLGILEHTLWRSR